MPLRCLPIGLSILRKDDIIGIIVTPFQLDYEEKTGEITRTYTPYNKGYKYTIIMKEIDPNRFKYNLKINRPDSEKISGARLEFEYEDPAETIWGDLYVSMRAKRAPKWVYEKDGRTWPVGEISGTFHGRDDGSFNFKFNRDSNDKQPRYAVPKNCMLQTQPILNADGTPKLKLDGLPDYTLANDETTNLAVREFIGELKSNIPWLLQKNREYNKRVAR